VKISHLSFSRKEQAMQSTNVRKIKEAIHDQTFKGRCSVLIPAGRVIDVRTRKGQLQAKTLSSGRWHNVESVTIA
jgi:hypothetical protein